MLGMYLRFYRIDTSLSFGWDQARDAWVVRDILQGKLTFIGPRTGIGHFHLGPLYYYLLAPFYFVTHLDPMASNYFNIAANLFNFVAIISVSALLYRKSTVLLITFIYAVNAYLVQLNRVPWNVSMVPGVSVLIFYSLYRVYKGDHKWLLIAAALSGFFFHLHLSAIFFPFIIALSLIFIPHKKKLLKWILMSVPLYGIWFVPNILSEFTAKTGDYFRLKDFMGWYVMKLHLRFLFHRIPDSVIQFAAILHFPDFKIIRYVLPVIFIVLQVFFEKSSERRFLGYLTALWFVIPLIGFTFYSGPLSDYYFLLNAPLVLFVIAYIHEALLSLRYKKVIIILLAIFWAYYGYVNIQKNWSKPAQGGLKQQKIDVIAVKAKGEKIGYNEGDIRSYLYQIEK